MVESFNIDGANLDTEFDNNYNQVDNLTCPGLLSFNTNSSHNGNNDNNNNIQIIHGIKRFNNEYHTVCITKTDICNETESKCINNTRIITAKHKRWWLKVPVELNNKKKLWIRMLGDSAVVGGTF